MRGKERELRKGQRCLEAKRQRTDMLVKRRSTALHLCMQEGHEIRRVGGVSMHHIVIVGEGVLHVPGRAKAVR